MTEYEPHCETCASCNEHGDEGICYNANSDHYGHRTATFHPACDNHLYKMEGDTS